MAYGNFPEVALSYTPNDPTYFNSYPSLLVNYLSPQNGSYIDSASPALYLSDQNSLGSTLPYCKDHPDMYCPAVTETPSVTVYGTNQTHVPEILSVVNADTLLNSNNCLTGTTKVPCSVFSNLGGASGYDPATDYVNSGCLSSSARTSSWVFPKPSFLTWIKK